MRKQLEDYTHFLVFLGLVFYPLSAMAGTDIFKDTTGFTLYQASYAIFMGFWGVLASFTQKYVKGGDKVRWGRVFLKDFVNATLASCLALMFCVYKGLHPALIGLVCTVAGYGGVSSLDFIKRKVFSAADKATGI